MGKKTVVVIGVFDGVHVGHKKILRAAVKLARRNKAKSVALTFYPHPQSVLRHSKAALSLISLKHRINLIKSEGIDECIVFKFTKRFSRKPADIFIKDFLVDKLHAGWVVVGEDFCFGKKKKCGCALLAAKGRELGFKLERIPILKHKGVAVSSSLIRQAILSGKIKFAKRLLGRPVTVLGTVVKGRKIGRQIGFPTANINPHHEVVPPSGVYAVKVNIDKKYYNGVLNIGTRPTFYGIDKGDKEPAIEVYIFNFNRKIYGKDIEAVFIKKIRGERKFRNKEILAIEIKKDIKHAWRVLCNLI